MARARKTANDGMSWLTLMPFPAFNPLNWGALALPHNALLASMHNTRLALDAWRASADGMRAMIRLHQDEMLRAIEAPAAISAEQNKAAKNSGDDESAEDAQNGAETAATLMMHPMIEATRAYSRVGRAFIVAQRDTMRAFTRPEQPH